MNPVQCATRTNFSVKASQFSSQNQNSVQRRQVRGVDVCHQICVAMAQTNGGQPQVTNKITFAISWVHTMWTSVLYVSKAAVVSTHCLSCMLAQHKHSVPCLLYCTAFWSTPALTACRLLPNKPKKPSPTLTMQNLLVVG